MCRKLRKRYYKMEKYDKRIKGGKIQELYNKIEQVSEQRRKL